MANGQKLWTELLKGAPKGSVLMGGAIVDLLADIEPKDYDIFCTYAPGYQNNIPKTWKRNPVNFEELLKKEEYLAGEQEGGGLNPIIEVTNFTVDGAYLVQLIALAYENPVEHFKNFDHSLTLGRWTDKGLFIHKKVFESLNNDTVWFVGKNKSAERRMKSLERAKKKVTRYVGVAGALDWDFQGF